MYIVIVGAGEVGRYVAQLLVRDRHEVALIEQDPGLAQKLETTLDALVIRGSGVRPEVLHAAGIERADVLLAVTALDEVNLVVCMTGRKYGNAGLRAVARVQHTFDFPDGPPLDAEDLGLAAVVTPFGALMESALDTIMYAGRGQVRDLAGGRLTLVDSILEEESPFAGETLEDVRRSIGRDFLVVAIQNDKGIRIPFGKDRIRAGERAFFLTTPDHLMELAILSGQPWHPVRHVLVVGNDNTGVGLARELERRGLSCTLVESDATYAERAAETLERSAVFCADGTDPEFLEARILEQETDAVVILARDTEKSMLAGSFAKALGVPKVLTTVDKPALLALAPRLGIDVALSPRRAIADSILGFVRGGSSFSGMSLGDHGAAVLQMTVPAAPANPALLGSTLKQIGLPRGSLVGAIIRNGEAHVGTGDATIEKGDELLVVSSVEVLDTVEKLLAPQAAPRFRSPDHRR